mmetsp:Transcript_5903/g.14994  ORF Transcript_5903/g.14994 Transcript_5903/m.14994 type:complete len:261 (-) Transcript_5903:184-966(-)
MPADLIHVDQTHCIEEVDRDLDTIVDAHRRDVLRRSDPRLVAVEAADVLVDPEGSACAAGVRVEFERALVRLGVLVVRIRARVVERILALVSIAIGDLRTPVDVQACDTGNQDPVDADASLRDMDGRPVGARVLKFQRVAVVLLEALVDLGEDLVERLIVDDEPQRAHLEASYQRSAEQERGDERQHARLHEHLGVLASLADRRVSRGRHLQHLLDSGRRPAVRHDVVHLVRMLHRIIVLALQAELLDEAFAVRDANVNG